MGEANIREQAIATMPRGGPDASWLDRRFQTDALEYLDRDDVPDEVKQKIIGVVAVELHPRRVGVLRERFPGITVVHADAASIRLPGRPFRVVANPPYGISSRLLRTLLAPNSGLVAADLVLQRALVCKFASRNARRFTLTVGLMLPRRAFLPPPHVDSAVLVVRRRKCGDWQGR
ncbi:methyltransferase [Mycobacterium tuberculosis variant bovis BCG str. Korea 1168P]|uniref:Probable methyltransferase n=1 Tax=Mycobacterium bovis (strain BCG / Pasteur 1173P2) TaxID=410289 RepID=A0A0H3M631_MYCBP|nr:rRNA adenine N-6-methyltransferase family protein [Mycobacterium tuberculosis]AHM07718.1 hypothetical protein BCGT_1798 [Mycobacterium tuberculosis variant bovis BCG str. ATCC 35743]AET19264.1 putative methyltransferase [Mycobacterium tuberculosis variant bovis BCG str. Mexico]AGE67968.1 methyltransferase [Mycobacterium tuberculosis variant bovis BCG str. Korea 1168P]AKO25012.1 methyltransferase [Mycobacterium tuberculosis variant bovis BCG]AYP12308.1 methyltransferase [Mycobacterium tuberc